MDSPPSEWSVEDAEAYTSALAEQVELFQDDPEALNRLLTLAGPGLERSAQILGELGDSGSGQNDTHEALAANFSRIGNTVPPESAARIAYGIAAHVDDDSELWQLDDGFQKYIDGGGSGRFRDLVVAALHHQGKDDAAEELLVDHGDDRGGLLGVLEDVGDWFGDRLADIGGWFADRIGDIGGFFQEIGDAVWDFANEQIVNRVGDSLREAISDVLDIEGRIDGLQEPGDYIQIDGEVAGNLLGLEIGVGAQARIIKTEQGYRLELSGEGSAGIAARFGLPGGGSAAASATGTASATFSFDFNGPDAEQNIIRAAETVVATGVGVSLLGGPGAPVGAVLLGSQANDDFGFLADHYSGATLQLESEATVSADLAQELGLPGAELGGAYTNAVAIEIPRDGIPSLVLRQELQLEGELDIPNHFALPGGGTLETGEVAGTATMQVETRVPIDVQLGDLVADPLGELQQAGRSAINGATTTLEGQFQFQPGVRLSGVPGVQLDGDEGIQIDLSAQARTRDLVGALGRAFSGDLTGALSGLGEDVRLSGSVRSFKLDETGLEDETIGIPGASVTVTAEYEQFYSDVLADFENVTPAEILDEFGGVLGATEYTAEVTESTATFGDNTATWTLDEEGRPISAEADLTDVFSNLPRGREEREATREVGNRVRSDDDGGHLIGHRFMGDQGLQNLFPQNSNFNRSAYLRLENEWADWIRQGWDVHVEVTLAPEGAERPDEVSVSYEVTDPETGEVQYDNNVLFLNEAGQTFNRVDLSDMPRYYG